jgi:hypothetical protein
MGTIRFNLIKDNPQSPSPCGKWVDANGDEFDEPCAEPDVDVYELVLDPTSTYAYGAISGDELTLNIQPSVGGAETLEIKFPNFSLENEEYWPNAVGNGFEALGQISPYQAIANSGGNADDIKAAFIKPQVDKIFNLAAQGEGAVVDFSVVLPIMTEAQKNDLDQRRDEASSCRNELQAIIEKMKVAAENEGYPTFRLPKNGPLVEVATFTAADAEAYAAKVCGNSGSLTLEAIGYNTISDFKDVILNT